MKFEVEKTIHIELNEDELRAMSMALTTCKNTAMDPRYLDGCIDASKVMVGTWLDAIRGDASE